MKKKNPIEEARRYVQNAKDVLNDNTIKFGEITSYSAGGWANWQPPEWDLRLGDMLTLPKARI